MEERLRAHTNHLQTHGRRRRRDGRRAGTVAAALMAVREPPGTKRTPKLGSQSGLEVSGITLQTPEESKGAESGRAGVLHRRWRSSKLS